MWPCSLPGTQVATSHAESRFIHIVAIWDRLSRLEVMMFRYTGFCRPAETVKSADSVIIELSGDGSEAITDRVAAVIA
jgi:hypothetical protein